MVCVVVFNGIIGVGFLEIRLLYPVENALHIYEQSNARKLLLCAVKDDILLLVKA